MIAVTENTQPRLLWVGDAVVTTGYGRVTEQVCRRLQNLGWHVSILGIAYNGDPHNLPFNIYPANSPGASVYSIGVERMPKLVPHIKPDIILVQDDSWNVGMFAEQMSFQNIWIPTVGYIAIDSENVRTNVAMQLRSLKHAICHTAFGVEELVKAGYNGQTSFVGHGVDRNIYGVYDKLESREGITGSKKVKFDPTNAFIFGTVAANSARKRLDLTIAYFAEWWKSAGKPDNAWLYLHTNWDGEYDLQQIADYCGIRSRVVGTSTGKLKDIHMPTLYNALDVLISTSEGESFGLTHLEAMACGVPNIAVRCAGLESWAQDHIYWVEPSMYQFTGMRINSKRFLATASDFAECMNSMYEDADLREHYRTRGLKKAQDFNWDDVAIHFDKTLKQVLAVQKLTKSNDAFAEFK